MHFVALKQKHAKSFVTDQGIDKRPQHFWRQGHGQTHQVHVPQHRHHFWHVQLIAAVNRRVGGKGRDRNHDRGHEKNNGVPGQVIQQPFQMKQFLLPCLLHHQRRVFLPRVRFDHADARQYFIGQLNPFVGKRHQFAPGLFDFQHNVDLYYDDHQQNAHCHQRYKTNFNRHQKHGRDNQHRSQPYPMHPNGPAHDPHRIHRHQRLDVAHGRVQFAGRTQPQCLFPHFVHETQSYAKPKTKHVKKGMV